MPELEGAQLDRAPRMDRDTRNAAKGMNTTEARYFVDLYYQQQDLRKASDNQILAAKAAGEGTVTLDWYSERSGDTENQILSLLAAWSKARPLGQWCDSVTGIGPVIAAGLMTRIDITKASTAGHIWRFAGLDPTVEWLGTDKAKALTGELVETAGGLEAAIPMLAKRIGTRSETLRRLATTKKGKPVNLTMDSLAKAAARRPWNASLKTLCWKLGESFVKVSSRENDVYGWLYLQRKALEIERNERGDFADQARAKLKSTKIGKTTSAYLWYAGCLTPELAAGMRELPSERREAATKKVAGKPGSGLPMLPPGHIQERSKRWAVKLFLAHYHEVAYRIEYGCEPPKPYVMEHMGHAHKIEPFHLRTPLTESEPEAPREP